MKTICNIWLVSIVFFVLFTQCEKEPEPEPEPEPPKEFKIVDEQFLNALIDQGCDQNSDGVIDSVEVLDIEYLFIDSCDISDVEGIQNFINLKTLDVSNNTALT